MFCSIMLLEVDGTTSLLFCLALLEEQMAAHIALVSKRRCSS